MSTTTQTRTAGPNPGQSASGSVVERIKARAIESRENSKANPSNGGRRTSQPVKKDMPNYPGLERWGLIEKIGDGAYSTVYRATDTKSEFNEVAVKVMRKYEMNDKQVSISMLSRISPSHCVAETKIGQGGGDRPEAQARQRGSTDRLLRNTPV